MVEIDDIFILARRNNFREWLRVWKMIVSRRNENNDLLAFARENKEKFTNVVKNEINELNSAKVSFGVKAEFSIIRNNKRQTMQHYFQENQPHVFNRNDQAQIKMEFDSFVETMKGEIEGWSERGSGWLLERIMVAYVNVARYQPLRNILGSSQKAEKQESDNQRSKQQQRMSEVGAKSCFVFTRRWEKLAKNEQIFSFRWHKLHRHQFPNTVKTDRQA